MACQEFCIIVSWSLDGSSDRPLTIIVLLLCYHCNKFVSFTYFEAREVHKGKCSTDEYLFYCCGILGLTMLASILQNCP